MQICPIHQVPMMFLLTSSYCPLCKQKEEPEISFEDLPIELKRVWIAKDVITQITSKKLIAEARIFIGFYFDSDINEEKPCSVCALGALVVSCLPTSQHKYSLKGISQFRGDIHKVLHPYFSSDQLDLIESAFEQRIQSNRIDFPYTELKKASSAYPDKSAKERMLAIMQNIVDNNGTFVAIVPE
jgi:hypothetical protein